MLANIVLLLLACSPVEPAMQVYITTTRFPPPYSQVGKTALSIRQGVTDFNNSMTTEASSYMDLVKTNKIFVDTSLFVKEMLFDHFNRIILIIAPSGWGKTTNLDMLKTFTEIQTDENGKEIFPQHWTDQFKYFYRGEIHLPNDERVKLESPLVIARHAQVLNRYLQRHATLYVSFKDTIGENYADVERKIALAISRCFKQHAYMMKVFQKDMLIHKENYETFKRYLYPNLTNIDTEFLINSMVFLCKVVRRNFYNYKIIVLIDDYETPVHSFLLRDNFSSNDGEKLLQFVGRFTQTSLRKNPFLERGFAAGTIKLAHCIGNFDIIHFVADQNDPLSEYFGFKPPHLHMIFRRMQIDENLSRKALDWYNKYDRAAPLKESRYNPVSMINFFKYKKIDNYWKANKSINFIDRALESSSMLRHHVMLLISKQILLSFVEKGHNVYGLGNVWLDQGNLTATGEDLFYLYLLGEGYLAELQNTVPRKTCVKVTSNEAAYEMAHWMIRYYQQAHRIRNMTLYETAFRLLTLLRTANNSTLLVQMELQTLYKTSAVESRNRNRNFVINDHFIRGILNCVVLQMQCMSKFALQVYYESLKSAKIVMVDKELRRGTIIEYRYCHISSEKVCEAAEKFKGTFERFTDIDEIILIGLNFLPNRFLQLSTKLITT